MGVLLLERKDWSTKYEEMREEFLETERVLKQENNAHLLSISDLKKREVNLKKDLGVEKQCVADVRYDFNFYYCLTYFFPFFRLLHQMIYFYFYVNLLFVFLCCHSIILFEIDNIPHISV